MLVNCVSCTPGSKNTSTAYQYKSSSFEEFTNDLFANEVSDIKKLSDKLLQTTINNSRESMDNMLAYSLTGDDKFLVPLFEGALEHDSSAMLFSIFKKRVNKQSIKGGSAVQVSAMGIKGYGLLDGV